VLGTLTAPLGDTVTVAVGPTWVVTVSVKVHVPVDSPLKVPETEYVPADRVARALTAPDGDTTTSVEAADAVSV
jgi:hypothetical protein